MTHNIIKTENYLLVVDDSKIKQNDFFYGVADGSIKPFIEIADEHTVEIVTWQLNVIGKSPNKKIAAHLPLNNAPILEGVPLLPPLEDEVERLVKEHWEKDKELNNPSSFKSGYKKAKEKYKYTEEDMTRAFNIGINSQFESTELKLNKDESFDRHSKNLLKLIQSLQQPKMPVGFECEDEYVHDDTVPYPKTLGTHPKTIVNPQGQTVWVGKYIY
jgi:hypothetical protein